MSRSTLALAYASRVAKPGAAQPVPRAQPAPAPRAVPRAPAAQASQPAAVANEVLLIAVRRSLASCRDTTQLRMLAAFE
jgi:hypothetical protein